MIWLLQLEKKLLKIEEYLDEYRSDEEKENESSTFPLIDTEKDLLKFKCDLLAKMLSKNAELIYDEDKSVDMYIIQVEDKVKKKEKGSIFIHWKCMGLSFL